MFSSSRRAWDQSLLVRLDSKTVPIESSTRFLGCEIDELLSWNYHVTGLCARLCSLNFALYRLKSCVSVESLLMFYQAHVVSRLRYGIIFWGPSSHFNRCFILQKRIIRNIFSLGRTESCISIFKQYNLLTLPSLFMYECAVYVHRNRSQFLRNCDINVSYNTRNLNSLSVPAHRSSLFERSPEYVCIRVFNGLPDNILALGNVREFKHTLKKYLVEGCVYSIRQFLGGVA